MISKKCKSSDRIRKSLFVKYLGDNWFKQEPLLPAKLVREKFNDKQDISMVTKYPFKN